MTSPTILAPSDSGQGGNWVAPTLAYVPIDDGDHQHRAGAEEQDSDRVLGDRVIATERADDRERRADRRREDDGRQLGIERVGRGHNAQIEDRAPGELGAR